MAVILPIVLTAMWLAVVFRGRAGLDAEMFGLFAVFGSWLLYLMWEVSQ